MKNRYGQIVRGILLGLSMAGALVVVMAVPNIALAFGQLYPELRRYNRYRVRATLKRLEKGGLVSISYEGDKTVIRLTKNGQEKILKYKLEEMKIKPQKRWDGKWRIVIFDIPEKFKLARNVFAAKLREIGFLPLQKSVWICPYPCEEEIDFLKEVFKIRPFVKVITAEKVDVKNNLIKAFNLV